MAAFTPNFSATQTLGNPSIINFQDTSTGTPDVLVVVRRIYITNAEGNYITANGVFTTATYTTWLLADATTSVDCLTQDTACYVRVTWNEVGGTALYDKIVLYGFYSYTQDFLLQLTKNQIPNPQILADTNYWSNKSKLHTLLKDAINAVEIGADIYSAQNSLNLGNYLIQNSADFF
ncbi:MAG: hypothetical protein V4538_15290 [Bacteroidota bacterium]